MIKRREELAVCEVAGPAEHDEVERVDLDEFRHHETSWFASPSAISGSGAASVKLARRRVLKQHFAVARKILDQRQRRAADRARVGTDDAGQDIHVGKAAPVEALDLGGDAEAELPPHRDRHRAVDHDRGDVDHRDRRDGRIGERLRGFFNPAFEGRAVIVPGLRRAPDRGGIEPRRLDARSQLIDRGAARSVARSPPGRPRSASSQPRPRCRCGQCTERRRVPVRRQQKRRGRNTGKSRSRHASPKKNSAAQAEVASLQAVTGNGQGGRFRRRWRSRASRPSRPAGRRSRPSNSRVETAARRRARRSARAGRRSRVRRQLAADSRVANAITMSGVG